MIAAVADTHAAIWLVLADKRLSAHAKGFIERVASAANNVGVSAITLAEVVYLSEKGRIPLSTLTRLLAVLSDPEEVLIEVPVDRAIVEEMKSIDRSQVPDLPDRLIAATARQFGVPVISRDRKIRASNIETIW